MCATVHGSVSLVEVLSLLALSTCDNNTALTTNGNVTIPGYYKINEIDSLDSLLKSDYLKV